MFIHNIQVYDCLVNLIKTLETWMRNFIWSDDIEQRKSLIVAWWKCYIALAVGGIELRSISTINQAFNLKLCLDLLRSKESWAYLVKDRVLINEIPIKNHTFSSILSSSKSSHQIVIDNSAWILGDGKKINF